MSASRQEYTARVVETFCEQFFFIRLQLSASYHLDRWFPIKDIVGWTTKS